MKLENLTIWSPLPFGVHRVPVHHLPTECHFRRGGLHCLSAFTAFRSWAVILEGWTEVWVSIAFRRSPRSGRGGGIKTTLPGGLVSIAFRRSPRSGPTRPHFREPGGTGGLHCLSAFTAFRSAKS